MRAAKIPRLGLRDKPPLLTSGNRCIRLIGYLGVLIGYLLIFIIVMEMSPMGPQMNHQLDQYIPKPPPTHEEIALNRVADMRSRGDVQGLIAQLNDSNANVRIMSVRSLGEIRAGAGLNNSKGFNPILSDLGYANMSAEPSLVPLSRALKDEDPRVRAEAAIALGKIKDARAVKPLADVLSRDRNAHVRAMAADALGSIGRKIGSEYALRQALADNSTEVSISAEAAMKAIGLDPYPVPLTGTYIVGEDVPDYGYEGYRLVVSNDGSLDAVYEVARPGKAPYLSVFVRSGDTCYIHGTQISPDDQVYKVAGDKWSNSKKNFTAKINMTDIPVGPLIQYRADR